MEAKKVIENTQGIYAGQTNDGTLRLTDFHLVFSAPVPQSAEDTGKPPKTRENWIPYPIISHCTFRPTPPSSRQSPSIRIRCHDFTFVTFNISDNDVAKEAFEYLKTRTCKLGTVEKLYAFHHKALKHEKEVKGWEIYDPNAEFRRQGISEKLPDKGWRITHINQDYTFCDTYPAILVVPSVISDNVLKYAKDFRSRNRIPALSYIHPVNNCTITRSSQPKAGITRKTNVQDEKLVSASFKTSSGGSGDSTPIGSQQGVVADTSVIKPDLSETERLEDEMISKHGSMYDDKTGQRLIYANQLQGMGSENMDKYKFAQKVFLSIENIHTMRNSLGRVINALKDTDITPLPPNRELLNANGWDRTSQLSALAQMMLDPYFRTIDGFITLVEKDWLSFGHNFRLRSGHLSHEDWFVSQRDALAGTKIHPGEMDSRGDAFQNVLSGAKRFFNQSNKDDADLAAVSEVTSGQVVEEEATVPRMVSPIFHQFLDCTYQLVRQNPERFEYNERFLRRLLYHLHSCQYGTFLYNSEKQRQDARVAERTASVWDYFLSRRAEFTNPAYDPLVDDHIKGRERIILPRLADIRWWHQVFGRTEDEMNGGLNAEASAANDRQAAVSNLQTHTILRVEGSTSSETNNAPLSLSDSQSVLTAVETAHETLTPTNGHALHQSNPPEGQTAFSTIKDSIAGLNIGKGMLGGLGHAPHADPSSVGNQELGDMTLDINP
ncbi:hypothetical protein N3K66_008106 [Trichothecium roseum]|uniref:Uncharacterized protein n=1 Tax=Trichothecium roseum TaxID=47278 RepID=A0ACC0UU86_9HYPO|nr:hypothetical protein N3K66_008106 [Trichothecium roseum]